MARRIACFLIIPLFIWGWSGSSGQERSRLRVNDCKDLSTIAGQSCYTLSVKETRNDPSSRFIDILVVVLMALNENPTGKPTVFLHSGPGNVGTQPIDQFNSEWQTAVWSIADSGSRLPG